MRARCAERVDCVNLLFDSDDPVGGLPHTNLNTRGGWDDPSLIAMTNWAVSRRGSESDTIGMASGRCDIVANTYSMRSIAPSSSARGA